MRFDAFCGGFNTSFSPNVSSEDTINWIAERNPIPIRGQGDEITDKNERAALIRTPGIAKVLTLPFSPLRGLWPGENRLFAAAGSHLFEIFYGSTYTYVDRSIPGFTGASGSGPAGGPIGNDGAPVQMFANGRDLLIISAGQAYIDTGNGPVPCQFSDPLFDLIIDPADTSGKTLTNAAGNLFDATDVLRQVQITGGGGFTIQTQTITSVVAGEALAAGSWGTPGATGGTGIEWLGSITYTDLYISTVSSVVGSTARHFGLGDVGLTLVITGGSGFTPGTYTIVGAVAAPGGPPVVYNGLAILDRSAGTPASTGGTGTEVTADVTASQGAFLDGYYFVAPFPATKNVFFSAINDGTSWDPIDYFTKGNYPDNVIALLADHEELYTFGDLQSIQVWRDVGNIDSPFQPDPGAVIHLACQARWSVSRVGNGVAWVGEDVTRGGRVAFQAIGYSPNRISTPAVEAQWATYSTVLDAVSCTIAIQGHEFWITTFPTANVTWVYDATTGFWAKWGWWNGSGWDRTRWMSHAVVDLYGTLAEQHYVGDWQNGNIYVLSFAYKDDNGTPIYRRRRAPHMTQDNKRRMYSRFEIDCDVLGIQRVYWLRLGMGRDREWQFDTNQASGSGVTLTLSWSDDRGQTFKVMPSQTLDPSVDVSLANAYIDFTECAS